MNLEQLVKSVVSDFINSSALFTALDVSNKVKEKMPMARHRDVRDLVRQLFSSDMEPAGYIRTPINVSVQGSTVQALLYHHVQDLYDLDQKYDVQQRMKVSDHHQMMMFITNTSSDSVADITATTSTPATTPAITPADTTTDVVLSSRQLWESMFKSQPSLFPKR